jgi:hypothetical protein
MTELQLRTKAKNPPTVQNAAQIYFNCFAFFAFASNAARAAVTRS